MRERLRVVLECVCVCWCALECQTHKTKNTKTVLEHRGGLFEMFNNDESRLLSLIVVFLEGIAEAVSGGDEAFSEEAVLEDEEGMRHLGKHEGGGCCIIRLLFVVLVRGEGETEGSEEECGLVEVETFKQRQEGFEEAFETANDELDVDVKFGVVDEWSLCNDELVGLGVDEADGIGLEEIGRGLEHGDSGEEAGLFKWLGTSKCLAEGEFGFAFGIDAEGSGSFGVGHFMCVREMDGRVRVGERSVGASAFSAWTRVTTLRVSGPRVQDP